MVKTFVVGAIQTNCYVFFDEISKEAMIVDPGYFDEKICTFIEEQQLKPRCIYLTHCHFDHILGVKELKKRYEIPVYAYRAEQEILENVDKNLSLMIGMGFTAAADHYLNDGQILELGGFEIRVIHTPGHTIGSSCYYFETEGVLFSGDTLFRCSVGRTDFPTGSMRQIHDSIHQKLFILPEETVVYPGHDQATDIRYEKMFNPY